MAPRLADLVRKARRLASERDRLIDSLAQEWTRALRGQGLSRSDLEELLPASAPSVVASRGVRERMPSTRHLGVVIDTGGAGNLAAAERFLGDLKARIKGYPDSLVGAVRSGAAEERRFIETYALQLMQPAKQTGTRVKQAVSSLAYPGQCFLEIRVLCETGWIVPAFLHEFR